MEERMRMQEEMGVPRGNGRFVIPIIILSALVLVAGGCAAVFWVQKNDLERDMASDTPSDLEDPMEIIDDTTWDLDVAGALTEKDAGQIKALYTNVSFNAPDMVGKKQIYNSPVYPYQFMRVDALPYARLAGDSIGFGAAVYAFRVSPSANWQVGFATQDGLKCDTPLSQNNVEATKAFAAFECSVQNSLGATVNTTFGAYNGYFVSTYVSDVASID